MVLSLELLEHLVGEQLIGDRRDLLGLLPRRGERRELSLEGTAFDVLVRRHLECQPVHAWKLEERRRLLAARAAADKLLEVIQQARARVPQLA